MRTERDLLLSLLLDLSTGDDRLDVQRLLLLRVQLVAQPRLSVGASLDDGVDVGLGNVRVLLVSTGSLVLVTSDDLTKSGSRTGSVLVLAEAKGDGVSESLEGVKLGDVGRLGGVLSYRVDQFISTSKRRTETVKSRRTLLSVEPVLGLSRERTKRLLVGLGNVLLPCSLSLVTNVVNVLLEGVLAVLLSANKRRSQPLVHRGALSRSQTDVPQSP